MDSESLLFVGLVGTRHSRTLNYFHGIQKKGVRALWLEFNTTDFTRSLALLRKRLREHSGPVVVASPSHVLVPLVLLLSGKRPVLDAGWPLLDGVISSRRSFGPLGLNFVKTYLIDFFAFHCSRLTLVETEEQSSYSRRTFLLRKRKLEVLFTGCDEKRFPKLPASESKSEKVVFFRGGNQPEAGLDLLLGVCEDREFSDNKISFVIVSQGISQESVLSNNVRIINHVISDEEISALYKNAWLALGQLSSHSRLRRTIPHKFFEAAFFSTPYLTANSPIMERFAKSGLVSVFTGGDSQSLKRTIIKLAQQSDVENMGRRLNASYQETFSQSVLSERFLKLMRIRY